MTAVGGGKAIQIEAFVVPEISRIQNEHLEAAKRDFPHLKAIWLSDVCRHKEELEIDLLVGADYLWRFQTGRTIRGEPDEPVAVETALGWVLSGPLKGRKIDKEQEVQVNFVTAESLVTDSLERDVHKLWDLETIGIRESNEVHEEFVDISFNGQRYSVKLPWKAGNDRLPSNYENSLSRMRSQVRKLRKEPGVLDEYDAVIKEQLATGIIERVAELEKEEKVHYIPHLAVIRREASTTKLRIVYDASSSEGKRGTSLNDYLHVGPSLNPLLFDILVKFREKRVVLIGDIEKAFLNVEVDKADRDCLRFLWLEDVHKPDPQIAVYRFSRNMFGLNASPFLLNATLRHHISKYKEMDPEFVKKMMESFYVDDLVTGGNNTSEGHELYRKTKQRMASGGFRLRKWKTNDKTLRALIAKEERNAGGHSHSTDSEEPFAKSSLKTEVSQGCQGVLGVPWNQETDKIQISFGKMVDRAGSMQPTKRNVLSLVAGLFDPLGIICPVSVSMKMLF